MDAKSLAIRLLTAVANLLEVIALARNPTKITWTKHTQSRCKY